MARALRIQFPDAYYHVICRGNAKKTIFYDDLDRKKFLEQLIDSLNTYEVILHSYTLMHNHFHLLVQTPKANLSEFMRRFNICYTGWFNYRHQQCGHVYQGRYRSLLVDADSYLVELSRYMHLNIVRAQGTELTLYDEKWNLLHNYKWSSLPGYFNKSKTKAFVNYDFILSMINGRRAYKQYVSDALQKGTRNPFEQQLYGCILGNKRFIDKIRKEHTFEGSTREQPTYKKLLRRSIGAESIIACVADVFAIDKVQILKKRGFDPARCIVAESLYRFAEMKQKQIGRLLGNVDYSSVSNMRKRFKRYIIEDKEINMFIKKILKKLNKPYSLFKI